MTIAVIGAGQVGRALAARFVAAKRRTVFGVRNLREIAGSPLQESTFSVSDAVAQADMVVLAVPWASAEKACGALGPLDRKIVIDCTNPLAMRDGDLMLSTGEERSGGELVASWCDGGRVIKTFNQTGFSVMADPAAMAARPVMFVAGGDDDAKRDVLRLVSDVGFEAIDAGPLRAARLLESLAMLWIDQSRRGLGRDFAFALTRLRV